MWLETRSDGKLAARAFSLSIFAFAISDFDLREDARKPNAARQLQLYFSAIRASACSITSRATNAFAFAIRYAMCAPLNAANKRR